MFELAGTENRIAVERMRYNEDVQDFNAHIKKFPANIIAGAGDFSKRYSNLPWRPNRKKKIPRSLECLLLTKVMVFSRRSIAIIYGISCKFFYLSLLAVACKRLVHTQYQRYLV